MIKAVAFDFDGVLVNNETYDAIVNKLMEAVTIKLLHEDMKRMLKEEEFVPLGKV